MSKIPEQMIQMFWRQLADQNRRTVNGKVHEHAYRRLCEMHGVEPAFKDYHFDATFHQAPIRANLFEDGQFYFVWPKEIMKKFFGVNREYRVKCNSPLKYNKWSEFMQINSVINTTYPIGHVTTVQESTQTTPCGDDGQLELTTCHISDSDDIGDSEPLPEMIGTIYTLDEFIKDCKDEMLIDYDGCGVYTNSETGRTDEDNEPAYPSDIYHDKINFNYKYVHWFNR